MQAEQIEEVKEWTSHLFLGEKFDDFLVREVQIVTYNRFQIDGHIKKGFYTKEEWEENPQGEFSTWKRLRPICFSLIKGKKLPLSFQIEFQLAPEALEVFLQKEELNFQKEDIHGLYLQVRYEEGKLSYVSGCSFQTFTLDKELERAWDESVRRFFLMV
ncbi:MAG: DUF5721 family protein [bacterium]|nr:DUF5721 family protein [bacterium]